MLAILATRHLQWIVQMRSSEISCSTLPSIAQNNRKRCADNSTKKRRTEGIRSAARDIKEIRSEEHVWTTTHHMQH